MKGGVREATYIAHQRTNRFRSLREQGYTDTQIARMEGTTVIAVVKALGPRGGGKRRSTYKIHVHAKSYKRAQQIAKELGYVAKTGSHADSVGSVAHLVEAIGDGYVVARKIEEREMADRWIRLSNLAGETSGTGEGDGSDGVDPEGPQQDAPSLLSFPSESATNDCEAGAEDLLPEHREDMQHGGDA